MGDNAAMQKLKMFFAMKMGKMKGIIWKALVVHTNQEKALKLLEGEAGQRLKAFLAGKLAGLGRRCWQAWIRHHDNIAAENMKNNENAKKVAIMLEKIARGLVHRIFNAFGRAYKEALEERAAQDAINARLGMMDEMNKAKLRVFLNGKRLGKMSTFFKWWADVMRNAGLYQLQDAIEAENSAIKDLEAQVAQAEAAVAGNKAAAGGLHGQLMDLEDAIAKMEAEYRDLEYDLKSYNRKIQEAEGMIADEAAARRDTLDKIAALEREIDKTYAERDALANELAGIAGEVGYVHKDSQF